MQDAPTKLLVLDINGTIAHYAWRKTPGAIKVGDKWLTPRPHLKQFLDALERRGWCFAIWTCSKRERAEAVAQLLFKGRRVEFVLGGEDCDGKDRRSRIKDMRKIWEASQCWNETNTTVVDDTPHKLRLQPNSLVLIPSFNPSIRGDQCLLDVLEKLIY